MPHVIDLIDYASSNKALDFGATFKELLGQKTMEKLDQVKQELAASMFDSQSQEDPDDQSETDDLDYDDEEIDIEDEIENGEE
jgi:hypothetical protein